MKTYKLYTLIATLLVALGLTGYLGFQQFEKASAAQGILEAQKVQEAQDQELGQYAINMMFETYEGSKMSSGKKQMLARSIVKVANDVFRTQTFTVTNAKGETKVRTVTALDQQEHFIMVVANESQFQRFAQSPTGPKGLAQLAKSSFFEALKTNCGVKDVSENDVWDTDLNLYAGACYFRAQIEAAGGNLPLASLRYNQGPNSEAAKAYANGRRFGNLEGLNYLASISYLGSVGSTEKLPGKPTFEPNQKVDKKSAAASEETVKPVKSGKNKAVK